MPIPTCRVCGCYMLPADGGRPPTTCGEVCRLQWKAARQRAQRAKTLALRHLARAEQALRQVRDPWGRQVRALHGKLERSTPAALAAVEAPPLQFH